MPVQEIRHPLIRHKLGLMRRADISTKNFRELAQEVGALLTYEATKDLPLENYQIEGWCGAVQVEKIAVHSRCLPRQSFHLFPAFQQYTKRGLLAFFSRISRRKRGSPPRLD